MKKQLYYVVSSLLSAAFLLFSPSAFAEKESVKYIPFSLQTGGTGAKDVKKAKENLEIPDVVQSTGQSETAVMSQKAVTDAIEAGSGSGIVVTQESGQSTTYVMSQKAVTEAINAIPKTKIVNTTGQSETAVMSPKAVTDAILTSRTIFNMIYPVGSIYMSISSVNPGTLFGGTWERFGKGRTIISVDENNARSEIRQANNTLGEERHQISVNEMPQHSHCWAFNDDGQDAKDKKDCLGYVGWLEKWRWVYSGISDTGGNEPMSMYQPSITCYVWIRTT